MKTLALMGLVFCWSVLATGCSGAAKALDGSTSKSDALDAQNAPDKQNASDASDASDAPAQPAADGALQCCTVTLGGPGTEDCPCAPYGTPPGNCRDVGRTCDYDACNGVVSCECMANDAGAPLWSCQILIR